MNNKDLKKRIIQISYDYKLSHLGSCLTAVNIIDEIYKIKKPDEKFILSAGHAAVALYCVIEKYEGIDAEKIFEHHGVHPDRCKQCHIDCSTGSLGQGLPISCGLALANRNKNVWCLISDGEMAEGSIWEALRIRNELKLKNLKVYLNFNGWGAYKNIEEEAMGERLAWFTYSTPIEIKATNVNQLPFLKDQDAHYKVMNEEEYKQAMEILK